MRATLERQAVANAPFAVLGQLICAYTGGDRQQQEQVMRLINPQQYQLERLELLTRFDPKVAAWVLDCERLPGWVRDTLPLADLAKVRAETGKLPPDCVGIYGNPLAFAACCRRVPSGLQVGLLAVKPDAHATIQTLTDWDLGTAVRVWIPPQVGVASDIVLEVKP